MKISVIGLGKLGLPFSFFLSSKNYKVLGYDINEKIEDEIQKNEINIEPKLNEYIKKYRNNFKYEKKIKNLIHETNITFLVLPTPSLKNGSFSNKYIMDFLKIICPYLRKKRKKNHLIVITSTVNPGSCEEVFIPYLKKNGLKNNTDFSIIYNPHFIAQGTTIYNLENPDLLLLGSDNDKAYKTIKKFYRKIYKPEIFKKTTFREGEISKIAINSYITSKISFANYISELCETSKNTDAKKVLDVIGEDKRINHKYLKIGTKFSGPCFPRDNKALSHYSKKQKILPIIPDKNDIINKLQTKRLIRILKNVIGKNKNQKIGICGFTYKKNTNIVKGSQGYDLLKLINKSYLKYNKINIYDKFLEQKQISKTNTKIELIFEKSEFIKKSDIIFIMYHFNKFSLPNLKTNKKKYIIDCWRCIKKVPKNYIKIDLGIQSDYVF